MRRYTFYIAIALFSFVVGSLLAAVSYYKTNIPNLTLVDANHEPQFVPEIDLPEAVKAKNGFRCDDKFLLAVWNRLRENDDLKEVFDYGTGKNTLSDCSEVVGIDKFIDLNGDGDPEAVVTGKGWINGISEISTWIVEKNKGNYKVVLDHGIGLYEIEKQMNKGFYAILISVKVSIEESDKFLYRFDGDSYKQKKCWTEIIAARDRRGQVYELKKPRKNYWRCWN